MFFENSRGILQKKKNKKKSEYIIRYYKIQSL